MRYPTSLFALLSNISGGLRFETSRPLSLTDEPVVAPDAEWERVCWISWYNSVVRDHLGAIRIYTSLYCEVSVAKSLLEQLTLVGQARPWYA